MTAHRVIDDHSELGGIGTLTHSELDDHVNTTPFVVVSGTVSTQQSRFIEAGAGIAVHDNGPGLGLTISSLGASSYTYPTDLQVSLKSGKSFGKFASGQMIPATGKTPAEVILMAIAESIDPTVSLGGSNVLTSAFNTTGYVTSSLTGSYTINSAGASVASVELQFRLGNSGAWSSISTSSSDPLLFDHVFNADPFLTSALNYNYIVTDTEGAMSTASLSLVPQGYAAPTISLSVTRSNPGGITGETNTKREKGNVGSIIAGTLTRNRANVPMTSYTVQFSKNGSSWSDVPGLSGVAIVGNPASVTIPSTLHYDPTLLSSSNVYYRLRVTDSYTTTTSSTTTISFLSVIFYGASSASPSASADVRDLLGKVFVDSSNPFNLETGSSYRFFTVALPKSLSITEVIDLDALNANITANYVDSSLDVEDGGSTPTSYNVYTMANAIPYTSNHRHRVTRA